MAGQIKVNQVQLGDHATAANNFVWQTNVDGTAKLARGNVGATSQDILTVDASGNIAFVANVNAPALQIGGVAAGGRFQVSGPISLNAATLNLSTSIPSWAKEIDVVIIGGSTNGTSAWQLQGGSGAFEATGYLSTGWWSGAGLGANFATGYGLLAGSGATTVTGKISLSNIGGNLWVSTHCLAFLDAGIAAIGGGSKTFSGVLDRLRLTTVNGTDLYDAGNAYVIVKG